MAPTNSTAGSAVAYLDPGTANTSTEHFQCVGRCESGNHDQHDTDRDRHRRRRRRQSDLHWSIVSAPDDGGAYFSVNDSNAASTTTVTFYAAGNYSFQVTVTDAVGAYAARNVTVKLTVNQTLSSIEVTPGDAAMLYDSTRDFTASGFDQFGDNMTTQPTFDWSVSGDGGSITTSGHYTAPILDPYTENVELPPATYVVTATSSDISGTANIFVSDTSFTQETYHWHYQQVEIGFQGLPLGTTITNQMPYCTFSAGQG